MISVYNNKTSIELGSRKIEVLDRYCDIIQKGRQDPVWFIENFLDVQLMDYQKWIIQSAWPKKTVCLVCSRNTGKSFIAGLYIMTRAILFPASKIWLMSYTSAQAQDTFRKMEDIAKHNIQSVKNEKCIFINEITRHNANTDGFIHDKSFYKVKLFNDSEICTLVGKAESIVGKRSNLSIFDEAAIIPHEFFTRAEPFTTQNADFVTGEGIDTSVLPGNVPNQTLYLSSAGDTSGRLWQVYKDCAKRMMMGFDDCFVADISCDIPLNPTINGKKVTPLFDKQNVESMMRQNPYRALREYYNIFDKAGGTDMVVSRDAILRAQSAYVPFFKNRDKNCIYGLFYDPAHQADNAFVLICEFYKDKEKGWKMRIINGINLLRILPNGDKRPMSAPEQLDWIRRLMLDYNGNNPEYSKLHLAIDPGSGGGGSIYADFLMQDWTDENGFTHRGVIDTTNELMVAEKYKFPQAVEDVLVMLPPQKYKNEQYAAVQEMMIEGLVEIPSQLPSSGVLETPDGPVTLTQEEIRALVEIDLMKEELLLMRKIKTEAGNIRYALRADQQRKVHDDRAFTFSMACYYLQQLRRDEQFSKVVPTQDMSKLLGSYGKAKAQKPQAKTPFAGRQNIFGMRKK